MRTQVSIKLSGCSRNCIITEIAENETPNETIVKKLNALKLKIITLTFLRFHSCSYEYECTVEEPEEFVENQVKIEDLFEIKQLHNGKDIDVFIEGKDVYDTSDNGFVSAYICPKSQVNHIAILRYNKGRIGGNHWHKRKVEYLYPTYGSLQVILELESNRDIKKSFILEPGQLLILIPGTKHMLTSLNEFATAIEFSPQKHDKNDFFHD
ncbi:MAG: cupin domain-containing protein [Alphaproteobacteria bacterium]